MSAYAKQLILFNSFLSLEIGVKEYDCSDFVADDKGELVFAHGLPLDGGELECGIFSIDLVSLVATFGVVVYSEVLTCLHTLISHSLS